MAADGRAPICWTSVRDIVSSGACSNAFQAAIAPAFLRTRVGAVLSRQDRSFYVEPARESPRDAVLLATLLVSDLSRALTVRARKL